MDAFLSKKQQLKEDLQRSRSRISISFDLWTSPNPYAILGVVAMWIDATGKRRSTVLGMRRVHGEHSGENLGSTVLELLKEYDIGGDQIGYFMLDNASSNDTAVEFILKELCPWMKPQQRRHRRLRCLGHIVNLCCQAFLIRRNYGQHWFELEKIELALKDFFAATMLAEGNKTSLADWFSTLDCLLREINETKDHYHDVHEEDDNDNFTWKYLQAYYAAQVLNPYRKWAWFRQEWVLQGDEGRQKWYESAQLAVKQLWETEYKGKYPVEALPPPVRKDKDPDPAFDRQREHKRIRIDGPAAATDLYEQYISTDRLHDEEAGCDEAIAYWLSRYDSQRDLARFALDLFAVSPMSDECERLFSSAKLAVQIAVNGASNYGRQVRPDRLKTCKEALKQARWKSLLDAVKESGGSQQQTSSTGEPRKRGDFVGVAISAECLSDGTTESVFAALQQQHPLYDSTIYDGGATTHVVNNKDLLADIREASESDYILIGDSSLKVQARGTRRMEDILDGEDGKNTRALVLLDVAFVPRFHTNIVSAKKLEKKGLWHRGFDNTLRMGTYDDNDVLCRLTEKYDI
ncbi:ribonuclease H-like protein [Hirsutella rhossiliensis]